MKDPPLAAVARRHTAGSGFIDKVLCDLRQDEDEQKKGKDGWGYVRKTLYCKLIEE